MGTKLRRSHGSKASTVGLYVDVQPDTKRQLDRIVQQTGSSKWAVIEALISRTVAELEQGQDLSWIPAPDTDDVLEGMPDLRSA